VNSIEASFHEAARLVKGWGEGKLPCGRSVEESLCIEGISFWDAIAPMLAFSHITPALSRPHRHGSFSRHYSALARKTKDLVFQARVQLASRGKREDGGGGGFLFLGFSHYMYRETLLPVAQRLAAHPGLAVTVLDDDLSQQQAFADPVGVTRQSLWQHWDTEVAHLSARMRKSFADTASQLLAPSGLPHLVEGSGLPWRDVRHVFALFFEAVLPRLLLQGAAALQIMERQAPVLLFSPDVNDPRTRIFCYAGRCFGVRTLEVQFGFYGVNDIEWRFFDADHLAVTGPANLEVMVGHGVARHKMTVTGSPRYDDIHCSTPEAVAALRQGLGIEGNTQMVLFASQPYYYGAFGSREVRIQMIEAVFASAGKMQNTVLVVKPHPLEDHTELKRLSKGRFNIVFTERGQDIRALIKASDAFVTFYSGTTFDALVMNKPTVNVSFPGACPNTLFDESGATTIARNVFEVEEVLRSINEGRGGQLVLEHAKARQVFLENWFYRLDGRASDRIADIARELIHEN
jgi:hypothetical protein